VVSFGAGVSLSLFFVGWMDGKKKILKIFWWRVMRVKVNKQSKINNYQLLECIIFFRQRNHPIKAIHLPLKRFRFPFPCTGNPAPHRAHRSPLALACQATLTDPESLQDLDSVHTVPGEKYLRPPLHNLSVRHGCAKKMTSQSLHKKGGRGYFPPDIVCSRKLNAA